MAWDIVNADCTTWLPEQARMGLRADAVICDPPYHLASIQKRFGKARSAPAKHGRDGAAARLSRGFMGSETDSGDIAFRPETWEAIGSCMLPGARLAAFGGSRTWWKLAAAIDAAGFEIEDTIMWVYGQGLVLRKSRLKPCFEPILLCRRPGPVRDLNIDACRVEHVTVDGGNLATNPHLRSHINGGNGGKVICTEKDRRVVTPHNLGRWPGNLILSPDEDVLACFPDAPGQLADARSDGAPKNNRVYGAMRHRQGEATADARYTDRGSTNFAAKPGARRSDSGSAARFFTQCEITEDEKTIFYGSKATKAERMAYCTVCDTHIRGSEADAHGHGLEGWAHVEGHPTVKPQSVLRHLTRLLVPPGGLVIDPFAGSCSLVEAAVAEGRDAIGIEVSARHAASGRARMNGKS